MKGMRVRVLFRDEIRPPVSAIHHQRLIRITAAAAAAASTSQHR